MNKLKSILGDTCIWVIGLFVIIVYMIINSFIEALRYILLRVWWLAKYGVKERKFIVYYTNERLSKNYFKEKIIPIFHSDELFINVADSKNTKSNSLEMKVFRKWAGDQDHIPIVIFFPSIGKVITFRYLQAFSMVEDFGEYEMLDERTNELKEFVQEVYK